MSIFKNLKKTLGFDSTEDESGYEESYIDVKKRDTHIHSEGTKTNSHIILEPQKEVDYEKIKHEIFSQVVSIFNESLPQFLKSSIDEDAQKKYLYDALDASVRSYIDNIEIETRKKCEVRWHNDRLSLATEIEGLKKLNKELEFSKEELKKQQLSADRQKRALMSRVHDLEMQVSSFDAEKEQYELENRSLVNKLKASNVVDRDFEELRAENMKLQEELNNSKLQIEKLSNGDYDTSSIQVSNVSDELKIQNEALKKQIEQLQVKEEMSDAIINELNEKASSSLRQLEIFEKENESLKNKLVEATSQLQDKSTELSESKHELEILDQIQDEVLKFESIKRKKDSKINELEQEIQHLNSQIKELEDEAESLKSTIEQNLYNQAISEDLLKKEISQLKESQKSIVPKKTKRKTTISNVKISAIDESIIDADWLISTPPEGTITRPASSITGEDFGYQAPAKKTTPPENDAQMSLW